MGNSSAPNTRTTKVTHCKGFGHIFIETLDNKIVRLYFDDDFFEIGQLVKVRNHYKVPQEKTGYIVEMYAPFKSGRSADVIYVHFEEFGLECFKPTELKIVK